MQPEAVQIGVLHFDEEDDRLALERLQARLVPELDNMLNAVRLDREAIVPGEAGHRRRGAAAAIAAPLLGRSAGSNPAAGDMPYNPGHERFKGAILILDQGGLSPNRPRDRRKNVHARGRP